MASDSLNNCSFFFFIRKAFCISIQLL